MARRRKTSENPESTIDPSQFSPDVLDLLRLLQLHDVRYVIVGGQAVIFYGHVRVTGDVDIFFERTKSNASNLLAALLDFWNGDAPGVSGAEDLLPEGLILQYGVPPNRIDLINTVEAITFQEAWDGHVEAQTVVGDDPVTVPIIGIEALVTNKLAVGRPQDLTDLAYLRRVAGRS